MVAGLPRYSDGRDIGLSRSTYTGSDWNRGMTEQLAVYIDLEHRFNDHWKFKTAAVGINERNEMTYAYVVAPTGVAADGSGVANWRYATDFNSHSRGLDMFADGDFNGFGFDQEVVLGANYSRYTSDNTMAVVRSTGANIFDLDNHLSYEDYDSIATRGTRTDSQYKIEQKGIYGTWRVKLTDPLTLIVGGRTSWYKYDYEAQVYQSNVFSYDSSSPKANNGVVTPYAGLIYALTPEWSAYASYADVFIPQSSIGVGGSTIEPITGSNYEVGVKGGLNDGRLNTSLALFRYDHENRAVPILNTESLCGGSNCSELPARCVARVLRQKSAVKCCQACKRLPAMSTTRPSSSRTIPTKTRSSPPGHPSMRCACGPTTRCQAISIVSALAQASTARAAPWPTTASSTTRASPSGMRVSATR